MNLWSRSRTLVWTVVNGEQMAETAAGWLEGKGAQHDVVSWAAEFGGDWSALWAACPRGDWLLAIALRRGVDPSRVAAAARAVARLGLDHAEGAERAWLEAALSAPSVELADAIEGRAAESVDPAHQAALSGIALAVRGDAADAASVPAFLVQAAAMDAADCGMTAAVSYVQRRSAELVREVIPAP